MYKMMFLMAAHDTGSWAGSYDLTGWTQPSPTKDGETLGQTVLRIGNDIHVEAATPGVGVPNRYVDAEAKDVMRSYPQANEVFTTAAKTGFDERDDFLSESGIPAILDLMTGHEAEIPADVNQRYLKMDPAEEQEEQTGESAAEHNSCNGPNGCDGDC